MRKQKGITLIALIITIIVMLILVGVTVNVAINGGLIDTAKEAARQTEEKSIYDQIVGSMKIANDGNINVKGTYEEAKRILGSQGTTTTLVEPATEDEITTSATLSVAGKNGTYTYTITPEEIILGAIEQEQSDFEIGVVENYSGDNLKNVATIRVTPQITDTTFTFTDETEAVKYVAQKEYSNEYDSIAVAEEPLKDLLVVMVSNATGMPFDNYDTMVAALGQHPDYSHGDFSTPQSSFAFYMTATGKSYTTVQEYAASIYMPTDKKLIIDGDEIETGVTWNGNIATYEIGKNGTYKVQLELDGKIGIDTITITGIETIGKYVKYDSDSDGDLTDEILFRVLYDEGELGQGKGAQIIVAQVSQMNDVTLGVNDESIIESELVEIYDNSNLDVEKAIWSYNHIVTTLNKACKDQVRLKSGITTGQVRNVGSNPIEEDTDTDDYIDSSELTNYIGGASYTGTWFDAVDGKLKAPGYGDVMDVNRINEKTLGSAEEHWICSRNFYQGLGDYYCFAVGTPYTNRIALGFIHKDGTVEINTSTVDYSYKVRPIVSLEYGVLNRAIQNATGSGSSTNPLILQ